jgi:hypothetical protein
MIGRLPAFIDFHTAVPGAPRRAAIPWMIILTRCSAGKNGGQEIFRPHPLYLWRNSTSINETQQG